MVTTEVEKGAGPGKWLVVESGKEGV